jgi:hypothetical protein
MDPDSRHQPKLEVLAGAALEDRPDSTQHEPIGDGMLRIVGHKAAAFLHECADLEIVGAVSCGDVEAMTSDSHARL